MWPAVKIVGLKAWSALLTPYALAWCVSAFLMAPVAVIDFSNKQFPAWWAYVNRGHDIRRAIPLVRDCLAVFVYAVTVYEMAKRAGWPWISYQLSESHLVARAGNVLWVVGLIVTTARGLVLVLSYPLTHVRVVFISRRAYSMHPTLVRAGGVGVYFASFGHCLRACVARAFISVAGYIWSGKTDRI